MIVCSGCTRDAPVRVACPGPVRDPGPMLMASGAAPQTSTCSEPQCSAAPYCRGLCRRCYDARFYRQNRARQLDLARQRRPPAVTRPVAVTLLCVSCAARFTAPAAAVGQTVRCPQCARQLLVTLDISDRRCQQCGGPVPVLPGHDPKYCSRRCQDTAKENRRADRAS